MQTSPKNHIKKLLIPFFLSAAHCSYGADAPWIGGEWTGSAGFFSDPYHWTKSRYDWLLSATTIPGTARVTLDGDYDLQELNIGSGAQIKGVGDLRASGFSQVMGGSIAGSGRLAFEGDLSLRNMEIGGSRKVVLNGTTYWALSTTPEEIWGYGISIMGAGAELINNGLFDINGHSYGNRGVSSVRATNEAFRNFGTINYTGTSLFSISTPFYNSGTFNIMGGVVQIRAPKSDISGLLSIAKDARLEFGNGVHKLKNATVSGGGVFSVSDGIAIFEDGGDFSGVSIEMSYGGDIHQNGNGVFGKLTTLTSTLYSNDKTIVTGDALIGTGTLLLGGGILQFDKDVVFGPARVGGGLTTVLNGRTTFKSWRVDLGHKDNDSFTFINNGLFVDEFDPNSSLDHSIVPAYAGNYVFNNYGEYRKTGYVDSWVGFVLNNYGSLEIQSGRFISSERIINFGDVSGAGLLRTPVFENYGSINPGGEIGRLNITGPVNFHETSSLEIDFMTTSLHDLLIVDGWLSLGGVLNLTALSGHVLAIGDSFVVASSTYGARGKFSGVRHSNFSSDMDFEVIYGSNEIRVNVISSVPEPNLSLLYSIGLFGVGFAVRRKRMTKH